jgi:hypothetical protein
MTLSRGLNYIMSQRIPVGLSSRAVSENLDKTAPCALHCTFVMNCNDHRITQAYWKVNRSKTG